MIMLVQTKQAKLWLNIAEILRHLTVGELYKVSGNTFEVADEFEKLSREFDNSKTLSKDQWSRGFELVRKVSGIKGVNELMAGYLIERTAEEAKEFASLYEPL